MNQQLRSLTYPLVVFLREPKMDAVDCDKAFRKVNCVNSAIPYAFPPTSHGYFAFWLMF